MPQAMRRRTELEPFLALLMSPSGSFGSIFACRLDPVANDPRGGPRSGYCGAPPRLLDLMLVIQKQAKHSCGITIRDGLIGVDDPDSLPSTPVVVRKNRRRVMSL